MDDHNEERPVEVLITVVGRMKGGGEWNSMGKVADKWQKISRGVNSMLVDEGRKVSGGPVPLITAAANARPSTRPWSSKGTRSSAIKAGSDVALAWQPMMM